MAYLIDTAALSELKKPRPNPKVINWFESIEAEKLFMSVLTIGEIQRGISKLQESKRRRELENWLHSELVDYFDGGRILSIDTSVAKIWGEMVGALSSKGVMVPAIDSLIAATCLKFNLVCVTPNVSDLSRCGIEVFDPGA